MFDTCRADQLGSYGYHLDTSPNVDKFAKSSMRFERAISQATITPSSVGSFMTSRYPQSCYITKVPGIPDYLPTIAEVLQNDGYNTNGIVSNILVQRALGFAHGFNYYNEEMKFSDITSPGVLSLALQRLAKIKDKPFFMYLLFIDPHTPYMKHPGINFFPGYKGKLDDRVMIPDDDVEKSVKQFSPDDVKYLRALYDGEIKLLTSISAC